MTRRHVVLAALAVLVAGCASPEIDPDAAPAGDGTRPVPGPALVVEAFDVGARSFEPTIGVAPDGTVFMTAFASDPGPVYNADPTVVASDDDGATWRDAGAARAGPPTTVDPIVHVDPVTGRVFLVDLYAACLWLTFSDDAGATWTTNPVACGVPGFVDHPTLTTAKPRSSAPVGYPNLVVVCVNRVADAACATSLNGGLAFGPLVPVAGAGYFGGGCGGLTGLMHADPEGRLYVPRGTCQVPRVFISDDEALTWRSSAVSEDLLLDPPRETLEAPNHDFGVAVVDGRIGALWASGGAAYFATSSDAGGTWSEPLDVTAPGVVDVTYTALAATPDGRFAFAYLADEGEAWDAQVGFVDTRAADVTVASARASPAGDALGAAGSFTDLKRCDPLCAGIGHFFGMAAAPDNSAWVALVDLCPGGCPEADTPRGLAVHFRSA